MDKPQKTAGVVKKVAESASDSHSACEHAGLETIDPRVRRTRKLLGDALRALLQERRFSAISVQDIAERATVNRATFYAHYKGKEELAASVFKEDLRTALHQRFSQCPSLTCEDLAEMAAAVFEFVGGMQSACPKDAEPLHVVVGPALQSGLYDMVDFWLSQNQAYKQRFPDASRETIATMLSWGIYGAALRWSTTPRRPPAKQVCREIAALFLSSRE